MEFSRVPPHSVEAEQAVLGGLMLRPEALPLVLDALKAEDFFQARHGAIWAGIVELAEKGQPFDAVTLGEWFSAQGQAELVDNGAYLIDLSMNTPSAANIRAYAEIVQDKALRRQVMAFGADLVDSVLESTETATESLLSDAAHRLGELQPAQSSGPRKVSEGLKGWFEQFQAKFNSGTRMTGLPTQWSEFNRITRGLQPQTLYIVAARPSMGKSIVGLNMALFSAMRGTRTVFFSLEMSEQECHDRNIASLAGVPHDWVASPEDRKDSETYMAMTGQAIADLMKAPLYIDATPNITNRQFEARVRRMHHKEPLGLIVVDHLHDFNVDPKLARFEYGAICQTAKTLAKELNIPVVLLAQLNRNVAGRTEKRPTLADLRESGEIEQKGDVICFIHREDYYDTPGNTTHLQGVVECHFAKGRNLKSGERINWRNRFDQTRLDDWEGELPVARVEQPKGRKGFGTVDSF